MNRDKILNLLTPLFPESQDAGVYYSPELEAYMTVAGMEQWAGYYGIFDAWGIKHPNFYSVGIEVKVSRSDWKAAKHKEDDIDRANEKAPNGYWSCYTSANENYILCPAGLIKPEEVGQKIGLLWYESGRLKNKKRAAFIKVPIHRKLLTLMEYLDNKYTYESLPSSKP